MLASMLFSIFALLSASQAEATEQWLEGVDQSGRVCRLSYVHAQDDSHAEFTLLVHNRTYANIPAERGQEGMQFEALTIDRGGKRFSPPIGAPITPGNTGIGLLKVSGRIVISDQGRPQVVDLRAVGGFANWYRTSVRCVLSQQ